MEKRITQPARSKLMVSAKYLLVAIFAMILGSTTLAYSQSKSINVTGVVVDENNLPIIGAQVYVKDATVGTVTGLNGEFMLSVEENSDMAVAYIGYTTYNFLATAQPLNITMQSETTHLDDLVVVAYGTQKSRDVVGSVATVKADNLIAAAGGSLETALQGTAAGLQVVTSSIDGTASQIKIRGVSSISSDTDPIWVIDGMIGSQDDVNINDVESINILKDASATAIYGSRGSNGVIIVTTKRGKAGTAPKISVNYKYGLTPIVNSDIGYASASESLEIMDLAHQNTYGSNYDPASYFTYYYADGSSSLTREIAENTESNAFDVVTRLGDFHEANVSVRSGGEYTSNYASLTYREDQFSLEGLDKTSISARVNSEYKKGDVTFGIQTSGSYSNENDLSDWGAVGRVMPFMPIYDSTSDNGLWGSDLLASTGSSNTHYNPLINLDSDLQRKETTNLRARANFYLDYNLHKITDGLSFRADASYNYSATQYDFWRSLVNSPLPDKGIYGSSTKRNTYGQQYHTFFTYDKTFNNHALTFVGGAEFVMSNTHYLGVDGEDVIGYTQEMVNIGTVLASSSSYITGESATMGLFARLNYKFMDRYLLGASVVREGSSKFSAANRWGNFFSLSAGWIFSDEAWMEDIEWIEMLKLRGSFGETGNQNIPTEATQTSITSTSTNGYNNETSMFYESIGNSGAMWEKTQSYDAGLDFALFKNRLNGSLAYYRQNVTDMLMSMSLPASAGLGTGTTTISANNYMWNNVGDMYNQGFEASIFYNAVSNKNFEWTTSFNITTNKNCVTALNPLLDSTGTGIQYNTTILKTGHAIGTYYMPVYAGVDSETGVPMIYKVDTDPVTGETTLTDEKITAEKTNLGNNYMIMEGKSGLPTYYGSWRNNFRFKQFDLGISLYFSGGNYIYNETELFSIGDGTGNLKSAWLTDSWKQPGDDAKYPQVTFKDGYLYDANFELVTRGEYNALSYGMDAALEKADFLRIQDITLGYTIPTHISERFKLSSLRVYLSASNIATLTGFSGYNPDMAVDSSGSNNTAGIEFNTSSNPTTAIYTVGIDLSF
ncbi:MAG: SusC/RagA family TonB-linked outer membrane protein [Rikenellaceae bacterium]